MRAEGGCHCGEVRFVAEIGEEPVEVLECNCSICAMTGFVHLIVAHGDFVLLSGREALTSYRFGTRTADHLFCRHCGVKSFYQPRSHPGAWSVNANCLDRHLASEATSFDGRNWERSKAALDEAAKAG